MIRIFFALTGFIFFTQSIQCQDVQFYVGKTDFNNAIILLSNGEILTGEVQDFNSPNAVELKNFNPFMMSMSITEEIERNLYLDRKKIKFRKNENDKFRLIPSNSIEAINFFDKKLNKKFEYKQLKIAKSIDGKIKETNRSLFLPLVKKDSIDLYGYHFYSDGKYATTILYLNNPKDDWAISPYDLRLTEIFAAKKKLTQRIISSYKFVSENCTNFHKWLDEKYYFETEKSLKNDYKKYYKTVKKEIRVGKKKLKTKESKMEYEQQKWAEYYIKTFTPAIEKYKTLCN
jgi:hypothetical protein